MIIYLIKVFVSSWLFETDSSQAGSHTNQYQSSALMGWGLFTLKRRQTSRVQQALPSSTGTVCSEAGDGGGEGGRLAVSSAAKDQTIEKWDTTINPTSPVDM